MLEEILITPHANHYVTPEMHIWDWRVAFYLFAGGLTAGILVFASSVILMKREAEFRFASQILTVAAPVILGVGLFTLFLDLSHKLYVWNFYLAFVPTSPMSWGTWCLLLVFPLAILLPLATLRQGFPSVSAFVDRYEWGALALDLISDNRRVIAGFALILGAFLGLYTGVLLSAFGARPFWNSGVLAPLFLASGLSGAAALIALFAKSEHERHVFTQVDVGLLIVEASLIALFVVNLVTASAAHIEASGLILGGEYTVPFWLIFFLPGVLIPIGIELAELFGKRRAWMAVAPVLVLFGGYMLRSLMTELGQASSFHSYESAFDPALLELLIR